MESEVEIEIEIIFQEEDELDLDDNEDTVSSIHQDTPEVEFDADHATTQPSVENEVAPTQKINHKPISTENCAKQKGRPDPCIFCGKTFRVFSLLRYHLLKHTGENPHICSLCGLEFRQRYQLTKHQRKRHVPEIPKSKLVKLYKCIVCGRDNILTFSGLRQHRVKSHPHISYDPEKEKPFSCAVCEKPYWLRENAIICAGLMHSDKPKCKPDIKRMKNWKRKGIPLEILESESPFYIELPIIYQEEERKVRELRRKKRRQVAKKGYQSDEDYVPEVSRKRKQFKCKFCTRTFKKIRAVKLHQLRMHVRPWSTQKKRKCKVYRIAISSEETSDEDNYSNDSVNSVNQTVNVDDAETVTKILNHETVQVSMSNCNLPQVQSSVEESQVIPESIPGCSQAAAQTPNNFIEIHGNSTFVTTEVPQPSVSLLGPQWDCPQVQIQPSAVQASSIASVAENIPNSRAAICIYCHALFSSTALYEQHLTTYHSNLRPYLCRHCGKAFATPEYRRDHEAIHNTYRYEGQPRYKCKLCPKAYHIYNSLKSHLKKVHQEGYKQPRKNPSDPVVVHHSTKGVKNPNRKPNNEGNFPCPHCDLKFTMKCDLNSHLSSHVKATPILPKQKFIPMETQVPVLNPQPSENFQFASQLLNQNQGTLYAVQNPTYVPVLGNGLGEPITYMLI